MKTATMTETKTGTVNAMEMRDYMNAQMVRILSDYKAESPAISIDTYAVTWISLNAAEFRAWWNEQKERAACR